MDKVDIGGTRYITGMESGYMKHKPYVYIYIIDCHKITRINMYIIYIYIMVKNYVAGLRIKSIKIV